MPAFLCAYSTFVTETYNFNTSIFYLCHLSVIFHPCLPLSMLAFSGDPHRELGTLSTRNGYSSILRKMKNCSISLGFKSVLTFETHKVFDENRNIRKEPTISDFFGRPKSINIPGRGRVYCPPITGSL